MTDQAVATPPTTPVQGQTTPAPAADPSIQPRPVTTPPTDPNAQQQPAAPGVSPPAPPTPPNPDPNQEERVPISRVNKLTQEKWEARRRAQQLEVENMELRRRAASQQQPPLADPNAIPPQQPQQPQQPQLSPEQQAQQILFNEKCNSTYRKGLEDTANTPNFHQALTGFQMFGGLEQFPDVVDAAINMDDGHRILHHLGTHPEIAEQVLSLPPGARAIKIGEVMAGLKALPAPLTPPTPPPSNQITQAPPPTDPVKSGVTAEPGPDDNGRFKSQEEYRAWRAKQFTRKR